MTIFLFPGQGSQIKGMGQGLFERFPELTQQADDILGYSIQSLCLEDSEGRLNQTSYTQPALYTVNTLMYLSQLEKNYRPDAVAGHSLGEYNALFAANVFDFSTGLQLVKKRGELMQQASGGGMLAIIGLDTDQVSDILQKNDLNSIDIANYNAPNQVVISGLKANIEQAQRLFEQSEAMMVVPLKVSGAFHSRYMQPAREAFANYLQQFTFNSPRLPVIANISAKPYQDNEIRSNLAEQITSSVQWIDTIRYLVDSGVEDFHEVGPGKVLTGLLRHILHSPAFS